LRFLADQNVEAPIVESLRSAGYDVLQIAQTLPVHATDPHVLEHARQDSRILVTNDKDFGELTFLQRKLACGIVLLRMPTLDSGQKAKKLLHALSLLGNRISGSMVVVTERGIRRRPFPELDR
jgi:predicted nuclease of predicted toxin-antitoxin system